MKNRNKKVKQLESFDTLLHIVDDLRERCPWDRKQTIASLRHLTIEEVYELSDAIISNNLCKVREELGDLILHIVFYAKIADEENAFDITDICNIICEKLIARHPHIYGDCHDVYTEEDVKKNWEVIKLKEKDNDSVLMGVPTSLPALLKAIRIQEKTSAVGFDWRTKEAVWDKVQEELDELKESISSSEDIERQQEEFGDLLFSLINYARFLKINPETALEKTNRKFITRFKYIEKIAKKMGKQLTEMSSAEMENCWNESKLQEGKNKQ